MFDVEKIRKDFPILQKKINGKPLIYFDNACMSLKPKQVIDKINEYYTEFTACGGRSQHKFGTKVTEEMENTRRILQKFLNSRKTEEIIFTKNTTEGINFILNSLGLEKGDKILSSDKEHNSVLLPIQKLVKEKGIKHEIVKSNSDNTFSLENFEKQIKNTRLVLMVHTSNLDGYTIPAKEIIKIAHENNALVMLDAAQSAPHKRVDLKNLDVDFLAASGHKMLGPTATGILYGKFELLEKLKQFIVGGETVINSTYQSHELEKIPQRFEAGLQHYAGIIGLQEAAKYLMNVDFENHEYNLNKKMTDALNKIKGVKIIGPTDPKLRGSIVSFVVEKIPVHDITTILDESANIMTRSGAHCVHSWFNAHDLKGSVRASMYLYNTEKEIEIFIDNLKKVIRFFK